MKNKSKTKGCPADSMKEEKGEKGKKVPQKKQNPFSRKSGKKGAGKGSYEHPMG